MPLARDPVPVRQPGRHAGITVCHGSGFQGFSRGPGNDLFEFFDRKTDPRSVYLSRRSPTNPCGDPPNPPAKELGVPPFERSYPPLSARSAIKGRDPSLHGCPIGAQTGASGAVRGTNGHPFLTRLSQYCSIAPTMHTRRYAYSSYYYGPDTGPEARRVRS